MTRELTDAEIAALPRFRVGLSDGFGFSENPDEPKDWSKQVVPFKDTEVNVLELIKHLTVGWTEGSKSGGAFSHATFIRGTHPDRKYLEFGIDEFRRSGRIKTCQCAVIDIDAKGFTPEEIREEFPSIEEFISRTRIGPAVAAVLPSKSLHPDITDTVVAHLLVVWENPLDKIPDIENLLVGIEQSVVEDIPELAEDTIFKKTCRRGGLDKKASKNKAGMWYGMRAHQKPMYLNPTAVLNAQLMSELQTLGEAQLSTRRRWSSSGTGNWKSGSGSQANIGGGIGDDNEYLTAEIVAEVTWLFENILPPPGEGTYNTFFGHIKQFCGTHPETFGDLFIEYVHTDTTGHRINAGGPAEQQLNNGNWSYQPSWKPLIRALNEVDSDWPFRFYEAHGYHTSIEGRAPNEQTQYLSRQRYYDCLFTGTHHYEIINLDD